jgi:anaerobic magnesium-protoporphyrin IX monomethyl ester cyclase
MGALVRNAFGEERQMNILLINPPTRSENIYGRLAIFSPLLPPLGLCYLASYLIKYGHKVEILDLNISNHIKLTDFIGSCQPDIVGITATTVSFSSAKNILKIIKSSYPAVITVMGGAHLSAVPVETINECADIDIGVIGEGEITFKELIDVINQNQDLSGCQGIIYRKNNSTVKTETRPLIENLDALPFPARNLLKDFHKYYYHFLRGDGRTASIISSRGCPYGCAFCTQAVFGTRVRGFSADYICNEIKEVMQNFDVNLFSFEDDIFNYDRQRLKEFCENILTENLNIRWGCSIRIDAITEGDIGLMAKAGCKKIYIGIETFSQRLQELIGKKIEKEFLIDKIRLIKSHDIEINASFMLGLPTETKKEILETIYNANNLPLDGAVFFLYTPYPGTPLRRLAEESGMVSSKWDDYSSHLTTHAFYPRSIKVKDLDRLIFYAYRRFYFSPKFIKRNYRNMNIFRQLFKFLFERVKSLF